MVQSKRDWRNRLKNLNMVVAKIERKYYDMILNGTKINEVRTESFNHPDLIAYIDSRTGELLGAYRAGVEYRYGPDDEDLARSAAAIDHHEFDALFHNASTYYVLELLDRVA